jgi:hypothetical protein
MTEATIIFTIPKNSQESVVVSLSRFNDVDLVDLRVHAVFGNSDEPQPTRKGVCLKIQKLPALIEALLDARAEAERRGLLD